MFLFTSHVKGCDEQTPSRKPKAVVIDTLNQWEFEDS